MESAVISERRPSGIAGLGALSWGVHFCHFYRDAEGLAEAVLPFLQAGLAANEQCVWLAAEPLPAARARRLLSEALPNYPELEEQGRIAVLDGDWHPSRGGAGFEVLIEDCLDREARALAAGHAGLRLAGSAFSPPLLISETASGRHRVAAYRQRVQSAFQGRQVLVLGSFALDVCGLEEVLRTVRDQGHALVCDQARCEVLSGVGARVAPAAEVAEPAPQLVPEQPGAASLAEVALRHLARLQRVNSALAEAVSLHDVCQVLRSEIAEAVGARRAHVAVASDTDGVLALVEVDAASPSSPADEPAESVDPWPLLERAYRERRPLWPEPPSRAVALPLTVGPRMLGAVTFELRRASELEPGDRALFEDLVRPLALAVDRACLYGLARQECDRAEEANRAKDEFLAVLGHELRNPLAPIHTALELMRLRAGDVALKERGIIERQLHHMVRLVDDLLDVARITRGALRLSPTRVELSEVVERAIEMASPMLDERAHRVSVSVPRSGMPVDIDAHRVAQAIANLLMNSAKYTPPGGSIDLRARKQNERVLLDVRDDGIGIEPPLLKHIFEPFVQRKQSLDRSHGGLGLGLTIARRLVELHGGRLAAASPGPGCGSTFTIELELAGAASASGAAGGVCPPAAPAQRRNSAIRVLVVDDNVDAAEMLAEALRIHGHVVGVAHDGLAALSLADEFRPDLALLDIGLPVMDGFDLAQRLKRRLSDKPPKFIAVTGYGQPSDRARSKQAGFDEHLVKPIDLARLNKIVSAISSQGA